MNKPFKIDVIDGKEYFWCSCGRSSSQPFCDGSHKGTTLEPKNFIHNKSETVFLCGCKKTKNPPFCDGSHNQKSFHKLYIEPDNKIVEINTGESILNASLRNNIAHSSACGGNGKCSTCRIRITSGLNNCSNQTEIEQKISKKLSFSDDIRLACQTNVFGDVKFKRLLLDKRDIKNNDQVTANKITSIGNIKNCTIMFCDIKGFTKFSESLSA